MGIAGGQALAERVPRGEPNAVPAYIRFTFARPSDYPIDILRKAGVDLSHPLMMRAGASIPFSASASRMRARCALIIDPIGVRKVLLHLFKIGRALPGLEAPSLH